MVKLSQNEGVAIGVALVAIFGVLFFGNLIFSYMQGGSKNSPATGEQAASVSASADEKVSGSLQGIMMKDEKTGVGNEVKAGDAISVNYIGKLANGTKFDSSYDRGDPIQFTVGGGNLIEGFDKGVIGMKVGGKRLITIPPELGYGSQAIGGIPANSTLVFEVELMKIGK